MGTSVKRSSSGNNLAERGKGYGIKFEIVDGMDVLAVRDASERAAEHCRAGKGPFILEMKTYRYRGHSMSDPANYRTRSEVDQIKKNSDPIENLKQILLKSGVTEDELKLENNKIKETVNEAAIFAQESPEPSIDELFKDITIN